MSGRQVLVAGAGVSGLSAVEALLAAGDSVTVTVTDKSVQRPAALPQDAAFVPGLTEPPAGTALVVTSPGFRPDTPLLANAELAGVEVIGEVELAWRLDQAKPEPATWLAVTGTNGKTTTVSMLESILQAAGMDAVACGNVGLPVVDAVRAGHKVLAVELSSFQLHWSSSLAAHSSVVLNLADDHLDWHGSLDAYGAAKARVYAGNSVAVFNADDAWSSRLSAAAAASQRGTPLRVGFTLASPASGQLGVAGGELVDRAFAEGECTLASLADVHPAGPHNTANALAAAALARSIGAEPSAIARGLRDFTPGEHRSVTIAESAGVSYVDDSKATNPHAADAALRAHERVVWIAGGLLKGAKVDELVAANAQRLDAVVLIGKDRAEFAAALARHAPDVPVREVDSVDDKGMLSAVRIASEIARPPSAVLLAPAAASMDMFTDYKHRGRAFADAVRGVVAESECSGGRGE